MTFIQIGKQPPKNSFRKISAVCLHFLKDNSLFTQRPWTWATRPFFVGGLVPVCAAARVLRYRLASSYQVKRGCMVETVEAVEASRLFVISRIDEKRLAFNEDTKLLWDDRYLFCEKRVEGVLLRRSEA